MKKVILSIIQIAVTVAVLYWVFRDPARRAQMGQALRLADYRWIFAAIIAYAVVELSAAYRWYVLLRVQGIRLSMMRIIGLFLIGMFYNQCLPGGTGGDIIKSYFLLKETPTKKAGALLAVVFDRIVGLVALIVITAILVLLRLDKLAHNPSTQGYLWFLLVALGGAVLALVTSFIISGFNLGHRLPAHFPGRDKIIEVSTAYRLYARHWGATALAFAASAAAHLATFATFLFVAFALHASDVSTTPPGPLRAIDFFAVMPIERTISAMPISFGGAGLREHVLEVMLSSMCGVEPAKAVLVGTLGFLVIVACSSPGGLIYLFYKPSGETRHVRIREMQSEVAQAEHEIAE